MNMKTLEQKRADFAFGVVEMIATLKNMEREKLLRTLVEFISPDSGSSSNYNEFYKEFLAVKGQDIDPEKFGKELEEKMSSYISKAPVLVLTNGLGQTMAFFASKAEERPFKIPRLANDFLNAKKEHESVKDELKWIMEHGKSEEEKKKAEKELEQLKKKVMNSANRVKSFLLNPSTTAYLILYASIQKWLWKRDIIPENKDFLEWFTKDADSLVLIQATREVLELLKWMVRFADAMLEGE
ncbi:hypothetical protein A3L04_09055 [Thermococcus chitonophagus]|uniref:CRISPR type III-B/RAMP module-associated protein Cmr5 n=1 Tax=Thermococcus chitonophagus TaxID=54262 RepID=A0A160VS45_9EURY|nr:type III-B CRISPR module-associated protein Cmr5 [Thermococcus chitonophagus]ASJ17202.1 hypothetical protein A3L04_09055 [Thermococcus chitonophagus]CUX77817.1 hypothetical protein CHITON_1038 [Thermococcus chitonophagus]